MTHPCEKQCPNYDGEQCSTCMIDDVEGVDLLDAFNEVLDELEGETHE